MTRHQHAIRRLAQVQQALASVRALKPTDWREATRKAESLRRLEAQERRWRGVIEPRRVEFWQMPF